MAIDVEESLDTLLKLIKEERFIRYPVYKEDIDHIIGVRQLRELLRSLSVESTKNFQIKDLMKGSYFVSDFKQSDELFRELQVHQTHMGIVIMENLIEKVMGDIADEYDLRKKETEIIYLGTGRYLVDGLSDVDDLEEILEIVLRVQDSDPINGFMIG